MLRAKEYYKILHFLKVETMDRFYPVEDYFYEEDEETGERTPVIYEGDSFLFETNRQYFKGFDYAEILLESSVDYDISELKLNLSEYVQGYDPEVILDAENEGTLPVDTPCKIVFRIKKSQTMSEASRNLTNIRSIELVTPPVKMASPSRTWLPCSARSWQRLTGLPISIPLTCRTSPSTPPPMPVRNLTW